MAFIQAMFKERKHIILAMIVMLSTLAFLMIYTPFFIPITLAMIFSLGIARITDNINKKFPGKRKKLVVYGGSSGLFLLFSALATHSLYRVYTLTIGEERNTTLTFAQSALSQFDSWSERVLSRFVNSPMLMGNENKTQFIDHIKDTAQSKLMNGFSQAGGIFTILPDTALVLLVFVIVTIVLLQKRQSIYKSLSRSDMVCKSDLSQLIKVAQNASYAMIFSNLAVGIVQGLIMTIGALSVGFKEWSIVFLSTFACSFFPVIGTAPVGILLSIVSFLIDNTTGGFVMLGVATLTGLMDNIVRPYLVSKSEKNINPIMSLVGIIGAITVFGFAGLFIGPFLIAFVIGIWPHLVSTVTAEARVLAKELTPQKENIRSHDHSRHPAPTHVN